MVKVKAMTPACTTLWNKNWSGLLLWAVPPQEPGSEPNNRIVLTAESQFRQRDLVRINSVRGRLF